MADAVIPDIGKYQIIELVGEGAMGVVYKARDSILDRTVAVKVMNEAIARQEDLRKRFLREAQAAASLQHPNVVSIYDLGDVSGHLYIAMEFVQGIDLEKLLESDQPLSLQAKLDIAIDVLTGLTFAHKRGIIHRDIKPANIRVTEDGRAKIMDFGVAHLASSSMTTTGSFLGTPSYMAPEQITEGQTTPQTDIFATGAVLFQLLTQMKPFEAPTLQNLFFRIITEKPKKVSELMPGLPTTLDRIVEKAMAKEPSERYASALDMANDLSAVRAKLSGPSYPESVSLSASVSSAIEQVRRKQSKSRNLAFAGGGALAAIILLIGWSQLTKLRSRPAPVGTDSTAVLSSTVTSPAATGASGSIPVRGAATQQSSPQVQQPVDPSSPPTTPAVVTPTPKNTAAADAKARAAREAAQRAAAAKAAQARATPPARPQPSNVQSTSVASRPTQSPSVSLPAPTTQNATVQPQLVPQQPVVQRPVETKPQESAPAPAPSPPTAADISPVVQAYARAIESRDVGAIRRVYPGLSGDQQRRFEQFFESARNINVTFRVDNVEGTVNSAEARLVGSYEYVNSAGRTDRQPVSFAASLRREAGAWRLVSVR